MLEDRQRSAEGAGADSLATMPQRNYSTNSVRAGNVASTLLAALLTVLGHKFAAAAGKAGLPSFLNEAQGIQVLSLAPRLPSTTDSPSVHCTITTDELCRLS